MKNHEKPIESRALKGEYRKMKLGIVVN